MASRGDDEIELLDVQCGNEIYGTESRSRQGSSDSSFRNNRTVMPNLAEGSNLSTTPESAETRNGPSNADGEEIRILDSARGNENYGTVSRPPQANPIQEQGSNGNTAPQSTDTGNRPSNADENPIQEPESNGNTAPQPAGTGNSPSNADGEENPIGEPGSENPNGEPGSNGNTAQQPAGTGNSPSNADGEGGQSGQTCCKMRCIVKVYFVISFLFHVAKLASVSAEMWLHGTDQSEFSGIVQGGRLTLNHILLENWDASWETPLYPPSHGDFAVYTIDDVERGINYAVSGYYNAEKHAAGFYKRMNNDSMEAVIKYLDLPDSQDVNQRITMNERHFPIEHGLTRKQTGNATIYSYSIADELEYRNLSHALARLLSTKLQLTIYSFRRSLENTKPTFCLRINGNVTFNDTNINGQVLVNLKTRTSKIICTEMDLSVEESSLLNTKPGLIFSVIGFCIVSILLTFIEWGYKNAFSDVIIIIMELYIHIYNKLYLCCLNNEEPKKLERCKDVLNAVWTFLKCIMWNLIVLGSDIVTIVGSCNLVRESIVSELSELDHYAVMLGCGCILQWLSSFRYFQFEVFLKYNKFHLLYKVLRKALPDAFFYMICVAVIFVGFWLCGYVVLGPYHIKFSTPGKAATALFALANADELYATFYMFDEDKTGNDSVLMFSKVYLTAYISVYLYVVVNMLIGMFTSAYEVITDQYEEAKPVNTALIKFIMHKKNNQLRLFLYNIADSEQFKSDDAMALKEQLNAFINENDQQERD